MTGPPVTRASGRDAADWSSPDRPPARLRRVVGNLPTLLTTRSCSDVMDGPASDQSILREGGLPGALRAESAEGPRFERGAVGVGPEGCLGGADEPVPLRQHGR